MNSFVTIILISITILLSGCGGTNHIKFVPSPLYDQVVKKVKDITFVSSKGVNADVAAGVHDSLKFDEALVLYVVINNHSNSEINFSTANIKAVYDNQPIYVYTNMEFVQYLGRQKAKGMRSPSVSVSPVNGKLFALSYLTAAAEIAANYDNAKKLILKDKTIKPGEANEGMIMLQKLNVAHTGTPLILLFKIGSDIHEIRFSITNKA